MYIFPSQHKDSGLAKHHSILSMWLPVQDLSFEPFALPTQVNNYGWFPYNIPRWIFISRCAAKESYLCVQDAFSHISQTNI